METTLVTLYIQWKMKKLYTIYISDRGARFFYYHLPACYIYHIFALMAHRLPAHDFLQTKTSGAGKADEQAFLGLD